MRIAAPISLAGALLLGCSPSPNASAETPDAGQPSETRPDVEPLDSKDSGAEPSSDAGSSDDAGNDASPDADAGTWAGNGPSCDASADCLGYGTSEIACIRGYCGRWCTQGGACACGNSSYPPGTCIDNGQCKLEYVTGLLHVQVCETLR